MFIWSLLFPQRTFSYTEVPVGPHASAPAPPLIKFQDAHPDAMMGGGGWLYRKRDYQTADEVARVDMLRPPGPAGRAHAHVFTFADTYALGLCHLARSVEAAGGWLHVVGLRDGQSQSIDSLMREDNEFQSKTRRGEPWHFHDKAMMLKKHVFLARAIRRVPPNATIVFTDAFDVLFQRPLADIVAAYEELALESARAHGGFWPVVFGGERNCWPFPHDGVVPVVDFHDNKENVTSYHEIPEDASLSADHHGDWCYPYRGGCIRGREVCSEWLGRHTRRSRESDRRFPFLCSGTYIGTTKAVRRMLKHVFELHSRIGEEHDQALMTLVLMQNPSVGRVDTAGRIFWGLHGHELTDLERPLCGEDFFTRPESPASSSQAASVGLNPIPGRKLGNSFAELRLQPLALRGDAVWQAPGVLHFNGNGKRYLQRCIDRFRREKILGGRDKDSCEGVYYDRDRHAWVHLR